MRGGLYAEGAYILRYIQYEVTPYIVCCAFQKFIGALCFFVMESVKICRFKTFEVGHFAFRTYTIFTVAPPER